MAHDVFICYANRDKTVAEAVCSKLEGNGIRCWIAPRDVPAGKWGGAIMEAVAQCQIMVLVFSASSNQSANCLSEVHAAFTRNIKIIPLRLDNTVPSEDMEYYLQTYHWLDIQTPPLETHLQGLVNRVQADLAQAAARAKKQAEGEAAREKASQEAQARTRKEAEEAARAKKEAEEAEKARQTALAKKEAEEAAKEKARQEAEVARAKREEEKARRSLEKRTISNARTIWYSAGSFALITVIVIVWVIFGNGHKEGTEPEKQLATSPQPSVTSTSTITTTAQPTTVTVTTPAQSQTPTQVIPPTPEKKYGGIIKIIATPGINNLGYPGEPCTPGSILYARPAVEYLLSLKSDGSGEVVGELAESYEWSPDYKSLTLYLRKGIRFHDGTQFNAEAVKYNLELHKAGSRTDLEPMESIDILDDYTIRLNLSSYNSRFIFGLMSLSGFMVSPTFLKEKGDGATLFPVGTGPFRFVEYKPDVSLKYEKNPDYWQEDKPYLDGIEFIFIADPVTQLAALKAGEAHVLRQVDIKDIPGLNAQGFNIVMSPGPVNGLAGDSNHPDSPFNNIRVRQAIAHAIDNNDISEAFGYGYWKSVNQWFPSGNPAYNPDIVGYPFNPEIARQLLAEAGYPQGFKTEIYYCQNFLIQDDIYIAIQGYLAQVGINAELKPTQRGAFMAHIAEGWQNQLVHMYTVVGLGMDPIFHLYNQMSSNSLYYDTGSLWIPKDYDTLLFETFAQPDTVKYKAGLMQLGKYMIDDYLIAIPVVASANFLVTTTKCRDFDMHRYGLAEWRPEEAWLSE